MAGLIRIVGVLTALWLAAAHAQRLDDLKGGAGGPVAEVIDGDTIRLKHASADIRLIGLQAPKIPLGRNGFKAWPLGEEARAALVALVDGRAVSLRLGDTERDRNGRTLAHVVRDDGLWIQGEMLRLGWARMYTFPDNRRLAAEMRALEAEARQAKRGIWAHSYYAIRRADETGLVADTDSYQIVVGRVAATAKTKDRIFLNFGDDFRSDFTVSVGKRDWPAFAAIDLLSLKGTEIEVRGWIGARGGPAVEITHPEQIAVLSPAP
ncbi:MAG: thermonuclease family protein [Alphaproteobacteria bacterium]|nr:thermonuclease family protein [Alphaproteobacteria bacterium]